MKIAISIIALPALMLIGSRFVGRRMGWDRPPTCNEHDPRLRDIVVRHVRAVRHRFEWWTNN